MALHSPLRRIVLAVAALLALSAREVQEQRGLDLQTDTLTQSVLIHPPVDASEDTLFLSTREHTSRSQLRLGDQLGRDFMMKKVGEDGVPRTHQPGTEGTRNED